MATLATREADPTRATVAKCLTMANLAIWRPDDYGALGNQGDSGVRPWRRTVMATWERFGRYKRAC